MTEWFNLPDLGEGIHEGEIVSVPVAVGDTVLEGQPILVVETDKATVEIPSPFTGLVSAVRVEAGEQVRVGEPLLGFDTGSEAAGPAGAPPTAHAPVRPAAAVAAATPALDRPALGQSRSDADEERAVNDQSQPAPDLEQPTMAPSRTAAAAAAMTIEVQRSGPVPASPATRRLARELGVDLSAVAPTGPAGLVTAADVRNHAAAMAGGPAPAGAEAAVAAPALTALKSSVPAPGGPSTPPPAAAVTPTAPPSVRPSAITAPALPDFAQWGPVERLPLRSVRRATARRMALAWSQIPHVSHQEQADITDLERFRLKHKDAVAAVGGRLSLTVFALKAAAAALKAFPRFNASLDAGTEEIVLKHYTHIGVAVDTERGLVVPVIRDVDRKSLQQLAIELAEVSARVRAGKVDRETLRGGTFTVTNIGPLGGTGFTPIINYPETAILGLGRARLQPKVEGSLDDYRVRPRLMLPLVLAFDHRVVDGADAARFANRVIACLEDPEQMLLEC